MYKYGTMQRGLRSSAGFPKREADEIWFEGNWVESTQQASKPTSEFPVGYKEWNWR